MSSGLSDWLRRNLLFSYILGCLIPVHGILWTLLALGIPQESLQPLKLPFAILPSAMAFGLTYLANDEKGILDLWNRLFRKPKAWYYYLISTISFLLMAAFSFVIRYFWDGYLPDFSEFNIGISAIFMVPFLLLFPGFAEEFGWRGFMQIRLRTKFPISISSFFVGLVWGSWHMMDFLMGNWPASVIFISLFFAYITGASLVIGFIYELSGGNVFIAMLAHFSVNAVVFFTPVWQNEAGLVTPILFIILIWVVAVVLSFYEMKGHLTKGPINHYHSNDSM